MRNRIFIHVLITVFQLKIEGESAYLIAGLIGNHVPGLVKFQAMRQDRMLS